MPSEQHKITVDGQEYVWSLSPDSGYMVVLIDHADPGGQRASVHARYYVTEKEGEFEHSEITSEIVGEIIPQALEFGWTPAQAAKEVLFDLKSTDPVTIEAWEVTSEDFNLPL